MTVKNKNDEEVSIDFYWYIDTLKSLLQQLQSKQFNMQQLVKALDSG
jgi:hypothetical protein